MERMKNLYQLTTFTLAVSIGACLPLAANAWPWGPQTYEECVAKEMKGRPSNQTGIVDESCRKQFPALPSFTKTSRNGLLQCFSSAISANFEVRIDTREVHVGKCSYLVILRDGELIKATSKAVCMVPTWTVGTDLVINFDYGTGSLSDTRDYRKQVNFECRETK